MDGSPVGRLAAGADGRGGTPTFADLLILVHLLAVPKNGSDCDQFRIDIENELEQARIEASAQRQALESAEAELKAASATETGGSSPRSPRPDQAAPRDARPRASPRRSPR